MRRDIEEAQRLVQSVRELFPGAVDLAKAVSLAARVEPELLRAARLRLLPPEVDAGAEADLWFSPLVQSQSVVALVLLPEVCELLREQLAEDPARLQAAWDVVQKIHASQSPALRLEEEITWLALSRGEGAWEEIERLLHSALAAMVHEERRGVARWAVRALPRLPEPVQALQAALLLGIGARARLGRKIALPPRILEGGLREELHGVLPVDLPQVPVGARLRRGLLELGDGSMRGAYVLEVPNTEPLFLGVTWQEDGQGHAERVEFRPGETRHVRTGPGPVEIRTLLGQTFTLTPTAQVTGPPQANERPREAWVLVAGAAGLNLPPSANRAARAVGEALAREGYGLIIGGFAGVDYVVTEEFAGELRGRGLIPADRLIQFVPNYVQLSIEAGRVLPRSDAQANYAESLRYADAVVLIGGRDYVRTLYRVACQERKPVLALPDAGDASREAYTDLLAHWEERPNPGISPEFYRTLQRSTATPEDAHPVAADLVRWIGRRLNRAPLPGASAAPLPFRDKWVLVVGTGAVDLPPPVNRAARAVGRALARDGYGLLAGGFSGVDYVAAEEFARELSRFDVPLSSGLVQFVRPGQEPEFLGGQIVYVQEAAPQHTVGPGLADALILIGGGENALGVFEAARRERKPILPLPSTGGAAAKAYEEILARWEEQRVLGLAEQSFRHLDRPISSSRAAEEIADYIVSTLTKHTGPMPWQAGDEPPGIVLSYAPEDEAWADRFRSRLIALDRRDLLFPRKARETAAGDDLPARFEQRLTTARLVVVLVSRDYLTSSQIREAELPRIIEQAGRGQTRLVWLPVNACNWQETRLREFQAAHDPSRPLDALTAAERHEIMTRLCHQWQTSVLAPTLYPLLYPAGESAP